MIKYIKKKLSIIYTNKIIMRLILVSLLIDQTKTMVVLQTQNFETAFLAFHQWVYLFCGEPSLASTSTTNSYYF